MRRLLFVVCCCAWLVACGSAKPSGPAWPEPSKTADDGGESIEPHESAKIAVAIEKSADPSEDKVAVPAAASASTPAVEADKPATTPSVSQPIIDDTIFNDEITIEIED